MRPIQFDPTSEQFKSVVGAVCEDEEFFLRLYVDKIVMPTAVNVVLYGDDFAAEFSTTKTVGDDGTEIYTAKLSLKKGLYWYYFRMDGVAYEHYVGMDSDRRACLFYENVRPWQLSVYRSSHKAPQWLNDGVMYQIMPDRFYGVGTPTVTEDKILRNWGEQPFFREADGTVKNRDFFGGNLRGIAQKLPYLASLNVKTIYLNPIFAAYSNHKYDTEDYEKIDPMFGTEEDFVELCAQAKKLGIRIILDGVFNHVGSGSKYFNKEGKYEGGAYNDKNSPYRDWFIFNEDGTYQCWWGFPTLPRINAASKGAANYFCGKNGIVPRWLKAGASGWRLDVVDEVDDCMLDKIVASAKGQMADCAIVGEVWEDASNKISYGKRRRYLDGSQLDSVMNYPLRSGIIEFVKDGNASALHKVVFDILNNYPKHVRNNLMNILGTHDTARILTTLAGEIDDNADKAEMSLYKLSEQAYKRGVEMLKCCAVLQYTMFGFPCVYYGDEVGMEGCKDPFCRGCYPWGMENKLLLDFYRRLGELRKEEVFKAGDFRQCTAESGVYAFARSCGNQRVFVAVNRGKADYFHTLDGRYEDMLTGRVYDGSCVVVCDGFLVLKKL